MIPLKDRAFTFTEQLLRRKDIYHMADQLERSALHRTLTLSSLVSLGIGCVVGAGIFVITGQAAALYAGPALTISFALCAVPCLCTGLCYGELSSMVPIAGSGYSFSAVALGELPAFVVAVGLTMENLVSASAVAVGWSANFQAILAEFNLFLPVEFARSTLGVNDGQLFFSGSWINAPAMIIILTLTAIISIGVKESATFNNVTVFIKISVLIVFILFGCHYALANPSAFESNLSPYVPPNAGRFGKFGWSGILSGAGIVFFANLGFDSITATAQECKNPHRDIPLGLIITLVVCTSMYIMVTTALTGMMDYRLLNVDAPVVQALVYVGAPSWLRYTVELGSIAGLTSVCLVCLLSMPRLLLTVAGDGLLPRAFQNVHPTFKTPFFATWWTGVCSATIGGFFPLDMLGELVSSGTLVAFVAVCYAMYRMRKMHPHYPREFRAPLYPLVPITGIFSCGVQLLALPWSSKRNYLVVLSCSLVYYFAYSRRHSKFTDGHRSDFIIDEDDRHHEADLELPEASCTGPPRGY